jgi:uncharacterized protein YjcR
MEAQREREAERNAAFEALSGEFEDFNRDSITKELSRLDELSSLPQSEQTKEFMRLLHYAQIGQGSLANLEQKFGEKQSTKPPPVSSKGAKKQVPAEVGETLDEAEELAKKEMEAMLS